MGFTKKGSFKNPWLNSHRFVFSTICSVDFIIAEKNAYITMQPKNRDISKNCWRVEILSMPGVVLKLYMT